MLIDSKGGTITEESIVCIPDDMELFESFRVLVRDDSYNIIGWEDFDDFPNDNQIMYAIAKNNGCSANIEKVYEMEEVPFAEIKDEL